MVNNINVTKYAWRNEKQTGTRIELENA